MTTKLICIECPRGCELMVDAAGETIKSIAGNFCKKGLQYAQEECLSPKRILTTTVRISDGRMLPVRTDRGIDKDKQLSAITAINNIVVYPPVAIGQILAKSINGMIANVLSTKEIK